MNAEKTSDKLPFWLRRTSSQRDAELTSSGFVSARWTRWRRTVILQRSMQMSSSPASTPSVSQDDVSCLIKASEANETQLFVQCLHCPAGLSLSVYQMRLSAERHWWTRDFTLQIPTLNILSAWFYWSINITMLILMNCSVHITCSLSAVQWFVAADCSGELQRQRDLNLKHLFKAPRKKM